MKTFPLLTLFGFTLATAVLLLSACVPAATPNPAVPTQELQPEGPEISAPEAARAALARQLGIDPSEVTIHSANQVDWPNSCLGLPEADEMCAEVITPGYLVLLEANGQQYEFHTDETGENVVLAAAPQTGVENPIISWSRTTDGYCQVASISAEEVAFGQCDGPVTEGQFVQPERQADLAYFINKYAPFKGETPAGEIGFNGQGLVTATPAEQRMIAEWASLVAQEASAGRGGASWSLAFAWHREGGLAGFCDDVAVYLTGEAYASSCHGDQPTDLGRIWLTSNQLTALYSWVDALRSFEYEHTDPATADAMTIRIVFSGLGEMEAAEAHIQAIQELAQDVANQLSVSPDDEGQESARSTLEAYFAYLNAGNYTEADRLYGGDYEPLPVMNPDLDPTDGAALLEAACTRNGFICLQVKNFVNIAQITDTVFRITFEFQNPDGSLLVFGPCCGADPEDEPPQTQFDYIVEKLDGEFKVKDLPVFVP
jgi:hypothetical protein